MKSHSFSFSAIKTVSSVAALLSLGVLTSVAEARSVHPCTPRVQAQPIYMSCLVDSGFVAIQINTLMSPQLPLCTGDNYFEYQTANIRTLDQSGNETGAKALLDGQFTFTLSPTGDAAFASVDGSIRLDSCVTPIHGAVSFGN
jgi:hypothetical protein